VRHGVEDGERAEVFRPRGRVAAAQCRGDTAQDVGFANIGGVEQFARHEARQEGVVFGK